MADPFLYERVYSYLLEEIRAERLRPGDRVPSEKELAEQFGVSRITSKRALQMLAGAGVLDRRRGRGSFVAQRLPALEPLIAAARRASRPSGSSCLGLVLPDLSDTYGTELLCAIEERSAEHDHHLIVRRTRGRQELEEEVIEALTEEGRGKADGRRAVDGLIVFPVHGEYYNASLVRLVLNRFPLVLVDRYLPGIPACAVHTDNVAAARALTDHLLDQGHERVAFLSPPVENTSSIEERFQGYGEALRERGLTVADELCFTGFHSTLPGASERARPGTDREALRAFVSRLPDVTAFLACEYAIAVMVHEVLAELGREDERDGGPVIACFDSPAQPLPARPFVHVRQDQWEMGRRAVDLLMAQLAGEEVPRRSVVPFSLVLPESARTPAADRRGR